MVMYDGSSKRKARAQAASSRSGSKWSASRNSRPAVRSRSSGRCSSRPSITSRVAEPISEEELQTAIKQSKAQFAYSSESVTNQGFWLGYASIVADTAWFEGFLDSLAAVTVEDVTRVADTYLRKQNRTVGRFIPQGL